MRSNLADPSIEARVDTLLKQMTLEEKIGQLVQYSVGTPTGPGTGRSDYQEMIAKGQVGSLFNLEDAHAANKYQHIAVEKSRLHIPLLNGLDVIHGYRTEFPVPLGLASTWDPLVVEKAARLAAEEASASGVRWTFSPMVDIARDARWGRIIEGAGEDPYLGSVMARAYVRGYQGKSWARRTVLPPVRSTMSDMERLRAAAITTRRRFPSTPCGKYIYRPFTLPSMRVARPL